MDVFIIRCIERIMVVCFSGLSIYLGYKLFTQIPDKADSQGKVVLPGGISIYMSRVGPGTFFALFGLIVLALSFYFSVEIQATGTRYNLSSSQYPDQINSGPNMSASDLPQIAGNKVVYSGFGRQGKTPEELSKEQVGIRPDLYQLNNLTKMLRNDLNETEREDIERLIKKVKLGMIGNAWNAEWGEFRLFKEWINKGIFTNLPEKQKIAAELYFYGVNKGGGR